MDHEKLMDRARDELFSHINRCGVLQATGDDQKHWMEETIEYLGERYPDLSDSDLSTLREVGIRFCQPAVPHGGSGASETEPQAQAEPQGDEVASEDTVAPADEADDRQSILIRSLDTDTNFAHVMSKQELQNYQSDAPSFDHVNSDLTISDQRTDPATCKQPT